MGTVVLCNGMDWRSSAVLLALLIGVAAPDTSGFGALFTETGPATAQNSSPSSPRPIPEIPFSHLKPDAAIAVELEPGAAIDGDAVWVPQRQAGTVLRIDSKTNVAGTPVSVDKPLCASLLVALEALWAASCDAGRLYRVDVKSRNVTASAPLPVIPPSASLAASAGSVWALTDAKGVVSRLDPATNAPVAEAYVAAKPIGVAAADDVVWITSQDGDLLTRINAQTNVVVETVKVGPRPGRVARGEGAVWTLNEGDGSVSRVDPKTNKLVTTIAVGESVSRGDLAVGEGSVWVSAPGVPLTRIEPRTNRVAQRFAGAGGGAVIVGHGSVWVAAGPKLTWRLDPKLVAAMRP
jgi:streptogramin lyase